jgi:hypothetical protein
MSFGGNENYVQHFNRKTLKDKTTGETHVDGRIMLHEVPGRTNHRSHIKHRLQQCFCYCMYIRCRGKVFTEPLPSNGRLF